MPFPFENLPVELAVEIIKNAVAMTDDTPVTTQARNKIYTTARSLALVSHYVREITMPFLLQNVILDTHKSVDSFIRALIMQKGFATAKSPLAVDYTGLVHRFWTMEYIPPIPESVASTYDIDYTILYSVLSKAKRVGFNYNSMHLLDSVLGNTYFQDDIPPFTCTDMTFGLSEGTRWNSLTATAWGAQLLKNITRLTVIAPVIYTSPTQLGKAVEDSFECIYKLPFKHMPKLELLTCYYAVNTAGQHIKMFTYTLSPIEGQRNAAAIREHIESGGSQVNMAIPAAGSPSTFPNSSPPWAHLFE